MLLVSTPTPNTKATYSKHPGHLLQTPRPPTPTWATNSKHPGHPSGHQFLAKNYVCRMRPPSPTTHAPTPNTQATYSNTPAP